MFTVFLYCTAAAAFLYSYMKDKEKTRWALAKSSKAFFNIMPEFLTVLLVIGLSLAALDPKTISQYIGSSSGALGVLIASVIGSVTLIPGFIAFPLARALLDNGAGLVPIAAFVSTLMMVGVATLPLEIKFFGKRAAFTRNTLAFVFSIIIALLMGVIPWVL